MSRLEHDRRPSIAHYRRTPSTATYDCSLFIPGLYAHVGRPERLRVFQEAGDDLTDLAIELVTGEARTAECLEVLEKITLTEEQIRWVHARFGELVDRLDRLDPARAKAGGDK